MKKVESSLIKKIRNLENIVSLHVVLETLSHLIAEERKTLSLASNVKDEVTVALMSDYLREQEKMVWMLTAYTYK